MRIDPIEFIISAVTCKNTLIQVNKLNEKKKEKRSNQARAQQWGPTGVLTPAAGGLLRKINYSTTHLNVIDFLLLFTLRIDVLELSSSRYLTTKKYLYESSKVNIWLLNVT